MRNQHIALTASMLMVMLACNSAGDDANVSATQRDAGGLLDDADAAPADSASGFGDGASRIATNAERCNDPTLPPGCLPGCSKVKGNDCVSSTCCTERGLCNAVGGVCAAGTDAQCGASDACRRNGACHVMGDRCGATLDTDCASTSACLERGRCRAQAGACVVTAAGCTASTRCKTDGLCVTAGKFFCAAANDGHCAKASTCLKQGRCTYKTGACFALKDADCVDKPTCTVNGFCGAEKGSCVVKTDANCQASQQCVDAGLCRRQVNSFVARCVALSDGDCKASTGCKNFGNCVVDQKYNRCGKNGNQVKPQPDASDTCDGSACEATAVNTTDAAAAAVTTDAGTGE